jgi:uncharacterized membrane protein YphA (DoxX/SURF4 family)
MLIGVMWLFSLRWKLPPDFQPEQGRGLLDWLQLEVEHAAFPFYGQLVETLILPNFTTFAWLIFLAELLAGILLLTGTFTRLGAAIGLLMAINLGIGLLEVPGEWPWSYLMMAMWHGTFVVAGAGRLWGIDQLLWRRYPNASWLWWVA